MRIVSGTFKGRHFNPPKKFTARPTTDFAKESLFNIINNHFVFEEITVLDLFSGTGSISFEFASRGCRSIHLVESDYNHINFINKIIEELKLRQITALKLNVFKYLQICSMQFDIIFADPPYDMKGIEDIPRIVFEKNLLKPDGWLIVEHSNKTDLSKLNHFNQVRNYGNVHFSFFNE